MAISHKYVPAYIQGLLPVEVKKPSHGVTATLRSFFNSVNQQNMRISPRDLLGAIGMK